MTKTLFITGNNFLHIHDKYYYIRHEYVKN